VLEIVSHPQFGTVLKTPALRILVNFTMGTEDQILFVMDYGLLQALLYILQGDFPEMWYDAVTVLCNVTSLEVFDDFLNAKGLLPAVVKLIVRETRNYEVWEQCAQVLGNLIKEGTRHQLMRFNFQCNLVLVLISMLQWEGLLHVVWPALERVLQILGLHHCWQHVHQQRDVNWKESYRLAKSGQDVMSQLMRHSELRGSVDLVRLLVLLDCGTPSGMKLARIHCMPMFQQFQQGQVLTLMIHHQRQCKKHWLPKELWQMVQKALFIVLRPSEEDSDEESIM
jgi:hypothetical protein